MTKHPLTNKKIFKKFWEHTVDIDMGDCFYTPDGMRAAYDLGHKAGVKLVEDYLKDKLYVMPKVLRPTKKQDAN